MAHAFMTAVAVTMAVSGTMDLCNRRKVDPEMSDLSFVGGIVIRWIPTYLFFIAIIMWVLEQY